MIEKPKITKIIPPIPCNVENNPAINASETQEKTSGKKRVNKKKNQKNANISD